MGRSRRNTAHIQEGLGARLEGFVRRLMKKPTPVDELFGAAINQAEAFNDLLGKVGGDRPTAERLVPSSNASNSPGATGCGR